MKYVAYALLISLAGVVPDVASQTRRTPARPASPPGATVAVTVTDGTGTPLEGVTVRVSGPLDREGSTTAGGTLTLHGLRAGAYRFRFAREGSVTLERDVTVPAGRAIEQHVMLSAADAVVGQPPATPTASVSLPPPGKAVTVSLPAYIEQNFIGGSQPQKLSSVACSGLAQSVLWQIREPWQNRSHTNADAMLYTIGGEGTLRMNDRDLPLAAGTFVSVPRGTAYGLSRRGRNPLIVLATLAGEPCVQMM